jgi:hypothetical protein
MKVRLFAAIFVALVASAYVVGCDSSGHAGSAFPVQQQPPPQPPPQVATFPPSPQQQQGRVLAVPFVQQQTNNWCWAASAEMILRYYNASFGTQCQILTTKFRGQVDCCFYPVACDTPGYIQEISYALYYFKGLNSSIIQRGLTFPEVKTEIDAGRPIVVFYTGSFIGHFVVLYGYDAAGQVYIHDPVFGDFNPPYGTAFTYTGPTTQLYWGASIYRIR